MIGYACNAARSRFILVLSRMKEIAQSIVVIVVAMLPGTVRLRVVLSSPNRVNEGKMLTQIDDFRLLGHTRRCPVFH